MDDKLRAVLVSIEAHLDCTAEFDGSYRPGTEPPLNRAAELLLALREALEPDEPVELCAFNQLCYGALFSYTELPNEVFAKLNHNTVAAWDDANVTVGWVGQGIYSFANNDEMDTPVIVVRRDNIKAFR